MKKIYSFMVMAVICCCIAGTGKTQCNASFTFTTNGLTINPANTSTGGNFPSFYWSWGDSSSPSYGTNPPHTYANAGMYVVCLTMFDSVGCQDTYCDTVVVTTTTGVAENGLAVSGLSIYPNPASDHAGLVFTLARPVEVSILMYDMTGKLVKSGKPEAFGTGKHQVNQDLTGIGSGIYFAEIRAGETVIRTRFIKLN
ncbi:MAG: immune inhibitor A [Bacteroidetes bacterium]|nr:MAG: immune inhibitor A [Bacteroidota bacterium]